MINLKNSNWILYLSAAIMLTFTLSSCSSDDSIDEEPSDNCTTAFLSQNAKGMFFGAAFNVVEGTATEDPFDDTEFRFALYGTAVNGDACDGFNMEKPDSLIIFSTPMAVGIYDLTLQNNVTFNDKSITNEVDAVVAICGAIEITAISASAVTGRIDAQGDEENILNGNFSVPICQ